MESVCYRCGYPLVGIADDQACPECGLLAGRSRRASDELHEAHPRWLYRVQRGVTLILLGTLWFAAWTIIWPMLIGVSLFVPGCRT